MVSIPYIKGLSEKFKRIMNRFHIKTLLKTTKYQMGPLKKNTSKKELRDKPQCVCRIPCECGREYVGETSRLLSVCIKEHKYNIRQGYFDRSKLVAHVFEEGHQRIAIRQIFYSLNPIIFVEYTEKWLICYVWSILLANPL